MAGLNRRQPEGYGVPSDVPPSAPLFQDTSGVPSAPPSVGGAQQILANPMFTAAAQQYGQQMANQGHAYLDRNISNFVAVSKLKTYFAVDTSYVLKKLSLVLFPFYHRDWSHYHTSAESEPVTPRMHINTPDLYIPVMSFVTYVLLTGLVLGTQQRFTPEHLGLTASSLLAWLLAEVVIIWLCLYILAVSSQLKWMDIIAYCGYKYVSMIVCVALGLLGGSYAYYGALVYTALAIAYFLVQSLRLSVQAQVHEGASKLRNYFLLIIALLQPLLMVWLTHSLVSYQFPSPPSSSSSFAATPLSPQL